MVDQDEPAVDEEVTVVVEAEVLGVETAPPSCGLITFVEVVTPPT
jgi:hypothetical protein